MGIRKKLMAFLLFTLSVTLGAYSQNPIHQWIESKGNTTSFKAVTSQPDIDVFTAPNIIMLKINKEVEVRIFTILGKLISSQRLQPGMYEYKMDSHGIYIVKTDNTSCKVAI